MRDIINTKLTGLMNRLKAPLISYDSLLTESRAPGLLRSGQWVSMLYLDIREFVLQAGAANPKPPGPAPFAGLPGAV